jgi:putative flippase GtrA
MKQLINTLLHGTSTFAQMFRYGFVAGFGLVVDFGTVIFTKQVLHFHYLIAACCGFLLGLVVTYTLSNVLVFGKPKGDQRKLFILFGVIGLVGLGILNLLMWIMTGWFGVNYILSKALATIVVFMWNFFARKTLYKDEPAVESLPYEL